MNAKNIAGVTGGTYSSRFGGKAQIVKFESSYGFALEMKREAAKHYREPNVKLKGKGCNWRILAWDEWARR
jgi:hypothetical protein